MTQPLKASIILQADTAGANAAIAATRKETRQLGADAKAAGVGVETMTAAMERTAVAAQKAMTATVGAAAAERDYKAIIERSTGVGRGAANDGRAADVAAYGKSLDDLRAKYNPLFAAGQTYKTQLAEIRQAERLGAISAAESAAAITRTKTAFAGQVTALNGVPGMYGKVADSAKLTANQMLNLSRQGNDVLTMFAMGAPPMQIFASQAGQIYGALEEGPGGLAGSLKAVRNGLMSLLTPTTLVIGGLTAVAAAGIYFATRTTEKIKPLNDAMEAHKEALKDIAAAYGLVLEKADAYQAKSAAVAAVNLRQSRAELEMSARQALQTFTPGLFNSKYLAPAVGTEGPLGRVNVAAEYEAFAEPLLKLNAEMEEGKGNAIAFSEAVAAIANADPKLDELASELLGVAKPAADAQRLMESLANAIDKVTLAAQKAYRADRSALQGLIPDRTTDRQQIEQLYQRQIGRASAIAGSPNAIAGIQIEAERDRAAALAEVERKEGDIRRGRELDLQAVNARTAAEKALIAAERERLSLSGSNVEQSEIDARAAAAANLVMAEAVKTAGDALRAAETARASAGLEGYAAGLAAINARYEEQAIAARGSTTAIEALTAARAIDIETLQIQTNKQLFGGQADELERLKAEASAIGGSADQRRRLISAMQTEQAIRKAGIDAGSAEAEMFRTNARALSEYEAKIKRIGDAWDSVAKIGESAIDDLVGGLTTGDLDGALDSLKDTLTKGLMDLAVANPLKNALLGTSHATMGDLGGVGGLLGRLMGGGEVPAAPSLSLPGPLGSSPVTPMYVSVVGGGLGLGNGAGGSIERLLNPGNDNNALLSLIRRAEGTAGPNGYNTSLGYGAFTGGERNLTGMTLDQIDALQTQMLRHPGNHFNSSALGAYQIVRTTRRGLQEQMGLSGSELFSEQLQDQMALRLAAQRGNSVSGLRNEWEGLRGVNPATITEAYASLSTTSQDLATHATAFTGGFAETTGAINAGIGQIADQFLPGFGGILQQLLDGMSRQSGGGGIGGMIGSLFGSFGSGTVSAGALAGIAANPFGGLYDRGGYTGPGGKHQPAGIVHKGEVVWSQDDVSRAGGVAVVESMRLGARGYAGGGHVQSSGSGAPYAPDAQRHPLKVSIENHMLPPSAPDREPETTMGSNGDVRIKNFIRSQVQEEVTKGGRPSNRYLKAGGLSQGIISR